MVLGAFAILGIGGFALAKTVTPAGPATPALTSTPDDPAGSAVSTFSWTGPAGVTFQCSVENGTFRPCTSPTTFTVDVSNAGQHQFAVRAADAAGRISSAASYSWKVGSVRFTLTGDVSGLAPGAAPQGIPVRVSNPNNFTIYLTSLQVTPGGAAGCPASGFRVQTSDVNNTTRRVAVPANDSVVLPMDRRPRIALVDSATNQDACKGASIALTYGGTASK